MLGSVLWFTTRMFSPTDSNFIYRNSTLSLQSTPLLVSPWTFVTHVQATTNVHDWSMQWWLSNTASKQRVEKSTQPSMLFMLSRQQNSRGQLRYYSRCGVVDGGIVVVVVGVVVLVEVVVATNRQTYTLKSL